MARLACETAVGSRLSRATSSFHGPSCQNQNDCFMQVNCCIQMLSHILESVKIKETQRWIMHSNLTVFHDILGGCERLLRTPIPVSYTRNSTRFLVMSLIFFPIATVGKLGFAVIPATTFVSFFFLGKFFCSSLLHNLTVLQSYACSCPCFSCSTW
jgi:hypothetical protein